MRALLTLVAPATPPWEIGDVLTFGGRPWPGTGHTALYLGDGDILHAAAGRVVEVWPLAGTILAPTLRAGWRLRRA
jgi:cell wall-associated NlpC family hydrolase